MRGHRVSRVDHLPIFLQFKVEALQILDRLCCCILYCLFAAARSASKPQKNVLLEFIIHKIETSKQKQNGRAFFISLTLFLTLYQWFGKVQILKARLHIRFTHAFSALHCVFLVITLT